MLVWK